MPPGRCPGLSAARPMPRLECRRGRGRSYRTSIRRAFTGELHGRRAFNRADRGLVAHVELHRALEVEGAGDHGASHDDDSRYRVRKQRGPRWLLDVQASLDARVRPELHAARDRSDAAGDMRSRDADQAVDVLETPDHLGAALERELAVHGAHVAADTRRLSQRHRAVDGMYFGCAGMYLEKDVAVDSVRARHDGVLTDMDGAVHGGDVFPMLARRDVDRAEDLARPGIAGDIAGRQQEEESTRCNQSLPDHAPPPLVILWENRPMRAKRKVPAHPREILVIDIGGEHVKCRVGSHGTIDKFVSGPRMTPARMMRQLRKLIGGREFDAVSMGY